MSKPTFIVTFFNQNRLYMPIMHQKLCAKHILKNLTDWILASIKQQHICLQLSDTFGLKCLQIIVEKFVLDGTNA